MNKSRITTILLAIALLASNAWWAYRLLDAGITQTYLRASCDMESELLNQTLAVLPVVAQPGVSRTEVLAAASVPDDRMAPFEKEGFVWVGQLGLKFDKHGRFVRAIAEPQE